MTKLNSVPAKSRSVKKTKPGKKPSISKGHVVPKTSPTGDMPKEATKFDPCVRVIHTMQGPLISRVEDVRGGYVFHRPAFLQPMSHPEKPGSAIVQLHPVMFGSRIDVSSNTNNILGFSPPDPVLQVLYARFLETAETPLTLETFESVMKAARERAAVDQKSADEASADLVERLGKNEKSEAKTEAKTEAHEGGKVVGSIGPVTGDKTAWLALPAEVRLDLLAWAGVLTEDQLSAQQLQALAVCYSSKSLKCWNCPDCEARCYDGPRIEGLATQRNVDYVKYRGANIQPEEKARELCDSCRAKFDRMDVSQSVNQISSS